VLTTIDTGTRIGRFLMQEFLGKLSPSLGASTSKLGAVLSTGTIVAGFTFFIITGNIQTIWPMFGIANQLLACTALSVGTTLLLRESKKKKYALVTFLPLLFVSITTLTAAVRSVFELYLPMTRVSATAMVGVVNASVTSLLAFCLVMVLAASASRWRKLLQIPTPVNLPA
jgi:carbon starvation protein